MTRSRRLDGGFDMPAPQNEPAGWTDVYSDIRWRIRQRDIAPGTALPTITELSRQSGLSRHGARRVLERLRDEGLARSWQGKGYHAAIPLMRIRVDNNRPSFHENVERAGRASSSRLTATKSIGLPVQYAERMHRRPGQRVQYTETTRCVDGHVFALSMDFFPADRFKGLSRAIAETGSVSEALAAHGVTHYQRDFTSVASRLPTAHEALMLGIPRSQPVYETVGANFDRGGTVVQVSTAVWRADCVVFEF
jgi:GntR family phosphonate transport system transcriptional regulator